MIVCECEFAGERLGERASRGADEMTDVSGYLPWSQQRGTSPKWADEVNCQVPPVVIRQRESGLHVFQRAHEVLLSRAGFYRFAEDQVIFDIPAKQRGKIG